MYFIIKFSWQLKIIKRNRDGADFYDLLDFLKFSCREFSTRGAHMVSFQLTHAGSLQCAYREIRCANLAVPKKIQANLPVNKSAFYVNLVKM